MQQQEQRQRRQTLAAMRGKDTLHQEAKYDGVECVEPASDPQTVALVKCWLSQRHLPVQLACKLPPVA